MQKRSDDRLIAYLDGELEMAERREIEAWLDTDPAAREKLAALAESANLVRLAFDEVVHEPLPDRLIAAARGETVSSEPGAQVLPFERRPGKGRTPIARRWWIGVPPAASPFPLLLGGGFPYFTAPNLVP